MDYGQIISQGWKITWNNKFLWLLGFFAAVTSSRANSSTFNYTRQINIGGFRPGQGESLGSALVALLCFALVVWFILLVVGLVAKGGLISVVDQIDSGKKLTITDAFSAGTEKIWPILGMNILLFLPLIVLVMAVLSLMGFALWQAMIEVLSSNALRGVTGSSGSQNDFETARSELDLFLVYFILVCCVSLLITAFLQFINAFAYRGIMLHNMGVIQSISHGWQVVKQNFGEVLVLSILFLLIGIGYGILTGIFLLPISFLAIIPLFESNITGEITLFSMLYQLGSNFCIGVIGAILVSVIVAWQSATFTLAYKEWTQKMLPRMPVS